MVMARMAQARPERVSIPARPPMLARVMDEDVPQVADDKILVERK